MSFKTLFLLFLFIGEIFTQTYKEKLPQDQYDIINPWSAYCPYDASQVVTQFSIDFAFYYAWFTSYAYCQHDFLEAGQCCPGQMPNDYWQIVDHGFGEFSFKTNEESFVSGQNNFVIWKSDIYKKFVLGFTGTREGAIQYIEQGLYRALISIDPANPKYKANEYVIEWQKKIIDQLYSPQHIEMFRQHPDYQIIFTGHSLGGASSVYMAAMMLYFEKYNFNNLYKPVILTFGGYRALNGDLAEFLEQRAEVYRVIHVGDNIPETIGCIKDFMHSDMCTKSSDGYLHAGRMYLLDYQNVYVSHCHHDYEYISDYNNCYNDPTLYDPNAHNHYFHDRNKISERCGAKDK